MLEVSCYVGLNYVTIGTSTLLAPVCTGSYCCSTDSLNRILDASPCNCNAGRDFFAQGRPHSLLVLLIGEWSSLVQIVQLRCLRLPIENMTIFLHCGVANRYLSEINLSGDMQYAAIHPYLLQRALYGVEGALLFLLHSSVDWMCCVLMLVLGVMQWSRVDHFVWCTVEIVSYSNKGWHLLTTAAVVKKMLAVYQKSKQLAV
ncbi:hypothetical protein OUZ56_028882 [Daphnia magna]|uniref:Uncharacterized protein n=1 Tax=Daphnia magna TaxID=35525 RepID=A0ABR0B582_9CRUS|nr:hypothetical protein OUZ56_028882 [Daphnia magna]